MPPLKLMKMLPERTGDEEKFEEPLDSFLTKRQIEVLRLRHQGHTQQEVADRLGTTHSNISIIEKRAYQNIERAERTQRQWMMICAPIFFKIEAGTDILDLPKMIFNAADKKGIELPITSLDIVMQLWQRSPLLCKNGGLAQNAEIFVTEEGDVLLEARKKNVDFP